MTQNWLAYHGYLENRRHNTAVEQETERSNREQESIARMNANTNAINATSRQFELQETARHNRIAEQVDLAKIDETRRHNAELEMETKRKNSADIDLREMELLEKSRASKAQEKETSRANKAREKETKRSNKARESQAKKELSEASRANRAREAETSRSNRATEREIARSNRARESETARSNRANESVARANARTNMLKAATDKYRSQEEIRIKKSQQREQERHNKAAEDETARHNEQSEKITYLNNSEVNAQKRREYDESGKKKIKSEINLNNARSKESESKKVNNYTSAVDDIISSINSVMGVGAKFANLF